MVIVHWYAVSTVGAAGAIHTRRPVGSSKDFFKAETVVVPSAPMMPSISIWPRKRIHPYKTKIGSPHVIATMQALKESKQDAIVGWDNGAFKLSSPVEGEHGALQPLETRDAFLPILVSCVFAVVSSKQVVDLMGELPAQFGKAGLIDAFLKRRVVSFNPTLDASLIRPMTGAGTSDHHLHFAHGDHRSGSR